MADPSPGPGAAGHSERLVVGLGHPDRGDDAVGPLVVEAVRALDLVGVRLELLPDPLGLVDLWDGVERVVVVDAARGGPAGQVLVHDLAGTPLPGPSAAVTSSHGMSLASVVDLARQVDRLPADLRLVTVAGTSFDLGAAPHQDVLDAVPRAAACVVRLLGLRTGGPG